MPATTGAHLTQVKAAGPHVSSSIPKRFDSVSCVGWGLNISRAMFKKPGSNKNEDPLAHRMRKVAGATGGVPEEITYSSVQQNKKRADRTATFKQGTITTRGGERVPVVLKNVSSTGARIEFFRDVQLGDHVLLTEPTLQIRTWAEVMWQARGAAGLRFVAT